MSWARLDEGSLPFGKPDLYNRSYAGAKARMKTATGRSIPDSERGSAE